MSTLIPTIENRSLQSTRFDPQFSLSDFKELHCPVHVVGVGAVGGQIVDLLGKLRVPTNVYDPDTVEARNCRSQIYGSNHIGMSKVEALSGFIKLHRGVETVPHCVRVERSQQFSGIVFSATDTLESREEVWHAVCKKIVVKRLFDARVGPWGWYLYSIDPCDRREAEKYEPTLVRKGLPPTERLCEDPASAAVYCLMAAAAAVDEFKRWCAMKRGENRLLPSRIYYCAEPPSMEVDYFS